MQNRSFGQTAFFKSLKMISIWYYKNKSSQLKWNKPYSAVKRAAKHCIFNKKSQTIETKHAVILFQRLPGHFVYADTGMNIIYDNGNNYCDAQHIPTGNRWNCSLDCQIHFMKSLRCHVLLKICISSVVIYFLKNDSVQERYCRVHCDSEVHISIPRITFQSNKWWINLTKNQFHSVQFLPICFLSRVIASVTRVIFSFHLIEFYTMNCISKAQVRHIFSRAIFLLLLLSAENLHTVRIKIIWCTVSRACVNPY